MRDVVIVAMFGLLRSVLAGQELAIENVALRQQLAVLRRHRPQPSLRVVDRLFWMALASRGRGGGRCCAS